MSKVISIDLELNQPSGKIIQIGYVIANIRDGRILKEASLIVNPNEPLGLLNDRNMTITDLTGITQEQVDNGLTLQEAYDYMCQDIKKYNPSRTPVQWGTGDSRTIRTQLGLSYNDFIFRGREFDVKTLFQTYQLFNNDSVAAGLGSAMKTMGLEFEGREHDALADAYNTFLMFREMGNRLVISDKIRQVIK